MLGSPSRYSAETVRHRNTFGNIANYVARLWHEMAKKYFQNIVLNVAKQCPTPFIFNLR